MFTRLLLAFGIFVVGVPTVRAQVEFLPGHDVQAGRWLATISIGGGVPAAPLFALRNTLLRTFAMEQGGFYRVAFDFNDLQMGGASPTRKTLARNFKTLKKEIEKYKAANPGVPTMVMLGFTGHGLTEDGENFSFSLADGQIGGEEIATLISELGADETVLVMQACQSGSLVHKAFPRIVEKMVSKFKAVAAADSSRRIAVMVPTSQYVNSPFFSWEEVLEESFRKLSSDQNGDHFVTYGEWKNYLKLRAIEHPAFFSEVVARALDEAGMGGMLGGIDPQFYEFNFSADVPMFLTSEAGKRPESISIPKNIPYRRADFEDSTYVTYRKASAAAIRKLLEEADDVPEDARKALEAALRSVEETALACLSVIQSGLTK